MIVVSNVLLARLKAAPLVDLRRLGNALQHLEIVRHLKGRFLDLIRALDELLLSVGRISVCPGGLGVVRWKSLRNRLLDVGIVERHTRPNASSHVC